MNRRNVILASFIVVVLALSSVVYTFLREPQAATAPIEAIPLEDGSGDDRVGMNTAEEEAELVPEQASSPDSTGQPEPVVDEEPSASEAESIAATQAQKFEIVQEQSIATFTLGEVRRGNPTLVVGTTNQVAGQLRFDPTDLTTVQIGTILINARTFQTDSGVRDRAIQNRILLTDLFEFISFEPTTINNLPASVAIGEFVAFEIVGDLTILNVTQQVAFAATARMTSENTVEGHAEAMIRYRDYDVVVPSVAGITGVDEEVLLAIDFVAVAINE